MTKIIGLVVLAIGLMASLLFAHISTPSDMPPALFKANMRWAYEQGRADEATRLGYKLRISTETPKYSSFEDFYKRNFQDEN